MHTSKVLQFRGNVVGPRMPAPPLPNGIYYRSRRRPPRAGIASRHRPKIVWRRCSTHHDAPPSPTQPTHNTTTTQCTGAGASSHGTALLFFVARGWRRRWALHGDAAVPARPSPGMCVGVSKRRAISDASHIPHVMPPRSHQSTNQSKFINQPTSPRSSINQPCTQQNDTTTPTRTASSPASARSWRRSRR